MKKVVVIALLVSLLAMVGCGVVTHTEKVEVLSVIESGLYNDSPNYYVETDRGVYQTNLSGIQSGETYYISLSSHNRIQKFVLAPNQQ